MCMLPAPARRQRRGRRCRDSRGAAEGMPLAEEAPRNQTRPPARYLGVTSFPSPAPPRAPGLFLAGSQRSSEGCGWGVREDKEVGRVPGGEGGEGAKLGGWGRGMRGEHSTQHPPWTSLGVHVSDP